MRKTLLATIALMALGATAQAGSILASSGNTQPELGATRGFINAAVFDTSGGSLGDHYGTGLAGIDGELAADGFSITSRYLYLFQDVSVGGSIGSSSVGVNPGEVTGDGFLGGIGFTQTTPGQHSLGPLVATPGNISPFASGAVQAEAAAVLEVGLVNPSLVGLTTTSLVALFGTGVGFGDRSELWGYTSDQAPVFGTGSIESAGVSANGIVPMAAVSEPSAVILLGISMGVIFLLWRVMSARGRRRVSRLA
jgi:hypothetical protein